MSFGIWHASFIISTHVCMYYMKYVCITWNILCIISQNSKTYKCLELTLGICTHGCLCSRMYVCVDVCVCVYVCITWCTSYITSSKFKIYRYPELTAESRLIPGSHKKTIFVMRLTDEVDTNLDNITRTQIPEHKYKW